jgi:cell division protein FtsB
MMRWTIALFAFALAALQLELWFDDDRRPGLNAVARSVEVQSQVNQELIELNADLAAEITNLRLGKEAAEERARAELGLTRPEESYFQVAERVDSPASE